MTEYINLPFPIKNGTLVIQSTVPLDGGAVIPKSPELNTSTSLIFDNQTRIIVTSRQGHEGETNVLVGNHGTKFRITPDSSASNVIETSTGDVVINQMVNGQRVEFLPGDGVSIFSLTFKQREVVSQ